MSSNDATWQPSPTAKPEDEALAKSLSIWPLDQNNVNLLNEVRHLNYVNPEPLEEYDLVVIGAGAGGLVSSRQVSLVEDCMFSLVLLVAIQFVFSFCVLG